MRAQDEAIAAQRAYYARTSETYDETHERGEHEDALRHVAAYLRRLDARTVLDTGCGTGLAMRTLAGLVPELELHGNDPSPELLRVAAERYGIPADRLDCVASDALPYPDGAFDAVVETGVLHHVPDPAAVVAEMLRVARRAVFISDSNIYGQPSSALPARILKLGLSRAGLLRPLLRLRRGGRDWYVTDEDGVGWSYSVFDTLPQVRRACAEVVVTATGDAGARAARRPLLFAGHCLLAGFKEPLPPS